jgi:hypothetical protein
MIEYGASPRALSISSKRAGIGVSQGEGNVFPNDVMQVALDVLRHRVKIVTYGSRSREHDKRGYL